MSWGRRPTIAATWRAPSSKRCWRLRTRNKSCSEKKIIGLRRNFQKLNGFVNSNVAPDFGIRFHNSIQPGQISVLNARSSPEAFSLWFQGGPRKKMDDISHQRKTISRERKIVRCRGLHKRRTKHKSRGIRFNILSEEGIVKRWRWRKRGNQNRSHWKKSLEAKEKEREWRKRWRGVKIKSQFEKEKKKKEEGKRISVRKAKPLKGISKRGL